MTLVENHEPSSSHVPELALRCYRAGEFAADACAEVDRHLASCPACRAKMRVLVEEQRAFEREIPFERFAGGVERAQRVPRQRPRRAWVSSYSKPRSDGSSEGCSDCFQSEQRETAPLRNRRSSRQQHPLTASPTPHHRASLFHAVESQ